MAKDAHQRIIDSCHGQGAAFLSRTLRAAAIVTDMDSAVLLMGATSPPTILAAYNMPMIPALMPVSEHLPKALLYRAQQPIIIPDTHRDTEAQKHPFVTGEPFWRTVIGYPVAGFDASMLRLVCGTPKRMREASLPVQIKRLAEIAALIGDELALLRDIERSVLPALDVPPELKAHVAQVPHDPVNIVSDFLCA